MTDGSEDTQDGVAVSGRAFGTDMTKTGLFYATLTVSLISTAEAISAQSPQVQRPLDASDAEMAIRSQAEFAIARIRNPLELEQYAAEHAATGYSGTPLEALRPSSRERLLRSVVFGNGGIGSLYYGDMRVELSPTQAYAILALFGAQHLAPIVAAQNVSTDVDAAIQSMRRPPDHEDKYCAKRATCRSESFAVCTSSC